MKKSLLAVFAMLAMSAQAQQELVVADVPAGSRYNTWHVHPDGSLVVSQQKVPAGLACECGKQHSLVKAKLPILTDGKTYCLFAGGGTLLAACVAKQ